MQVFELNYVAHHAKTMVVEYGPQVNCSVSVRKHGSQALGGSHRSYSTVSVQAEEISFPFLPSFLHSSILQNLIRRCINCFNPVGIKLREESNKLRVRLFN